MEKYTDLDQVLNDQSLIIITDNVSTLKELNRAFLRYKVMPRKLKRISNYYSNRFLGYGVSEMYLLMKDKLSGENEFLEKLKQEDKYLISEPDLYYKEESFNSDETNICFVLGHSGSGKSVMSRRLEGDDIDHIELDDLLLTKDHFTMDELKDYSDMIYSFFAGEGSEYYIGVDERDNIPKEEYEDKVFIDFIHYAMDYAKKHKDKKFIIDGIWIYLYFDDPSVFEDYAVFIKGTSFLKSKIRATRREMQRDKETLKDRKQMFGRETRNYFLDEDKIDRYREYYSNKPETIFREETNEFAKQEEYVLNELKNIDECFMNDDPDGIRNIIKRAEENNELYKWNRIRIIGEAQTALLDLQIRSNLSEFTGQ